MNTDNVRRLRDLLARVAKHHPERFYMARWFGHSSCGSFDEALDRYGVAAADPDPKHCGAAACMAGWCQMAFAKRYYDQLEPADQFARNFLDLSPREAGEWFCGEWSNKDIADITAADAVAFLDEQLVQRLDRFGALQDH